MRRPFPFFIAMLVPAMIAVLVTVEGIRTGRLELDPGPVTDSIPDQFYGPSSFLPDGLLDSAGWVIAACVLGIVIAALLAGRSALAARTKGRR